MEMRNKFVNHARNLWDRVVVLLPRVDQFWYKYAFMEEKLGQVAKARQIFERWMKFEPDHNGWNSYVKLELRHGNADRVYSLSEHRTAPLHYFSFFSGTPDLRALACVPQRSQNLPEVCQIRG
jgi:hypothetical protein